MRTIAITLASVCLLLLCSCATTPPQVAIVPATELPAAVTMNQGAGRGGHLILTLQLENGKKLPFGVDTGSPMTLLDKSLEPELGKRLGTGTFWHFGVKQKGNFYAAPKLYLGNTRLITGKYVLAFDIKRQLSRPHDRVLGILGMDCLKHYCIQLDFKAEKVRFLNPDRLNPAGLGKAFRITFSSAGQSVRDLDLFRPLIHQGSVIGENGHNLLVDTGDQYDGALRSALFRREVRNQSSRTKEGAFKFHPPGGNEWFPKCVWDGETYTNLILGNAGPSLSKNSGNLIGLRFLARHLVTLNFPRRTMYLKQTSVGPLPGDRFVKQQVKLQTWLTSAMASLKEALKSGKSPRVKSAQSAIEFLTKLKKEGHLPGWSKHDHGTVNVDFFHEKNLSPAKDELHSYFYGPVTYPESEEISGRKKGDSSTYHYKVIRASKTSPWKLVKAWRTDTKGHLIKEYPDVGEATNSVARSKPITPIPALAVAAKAKGIPLVGSERRTGTNALSPSDVLQASLPTAVNLNEDAGSGGLLLVTLRLRGGEELPFIVDTGTPVTIFDESLEPKLGKRLRSVRGWLQGGGQQSGVYVAPKLYLGDTRLITGTNVFAFDFRWLSSLLGRPIMGILGMDCLRHYCVQLDFAAEKMRFLDPDLTNVVVLGKTFPLTFSNEGEGNTNFIRPYICHPGLLGGMATNVLIDTGDDSDGHVENGRIKGHYFIRALSFLTVTFSKIPMQVHLRKRIWGGETYTNLGVVEAAHENSLGLRFLARHLVTFDFPKRTMYLKQTSVGPRHSEVSVKLHGSFRAAVVPLLTLKQNGELPGWSRQDKGTARLGSYSQFIPEPARAKGAVYLEAFSRARTKSATITFQKKGDRTIYHYVVTRASKESPWKLQKAWRTDARGRLIEKYPVP